MAALPSLLAVSDSVNAAEKDLDDDAAGAKDDSDSKDAEGGLVRSGRGGGEGGCVWIVNCLLL